jgi:threonine dehydrogenase-like Zn-dependent dehydrogenase
VRAVRVVAAGVIEVADVPEPSNSDLYTVAVRQVGICGTDTKILAGKIGVDYPRTMIRDRRRDGRASRRFRPGDRVMVDPGGLRVV